MKNLFLLIGVIIICSLLAGCGNEDTKYRKNNVDIFDYSGTQRIFVDKENGVQYIVIGICDQKCMSVRLDADGKPMVDKGVKK